MKQIIEKITSTLRSLRERCCGVSRIVARRVSPMYARHRAKIAYARTHAGELRSFMYRAVRKGHDRIRSHKFLCSAVEQFHILREKCDMKMRVGVQRVSPMCARYRTKIAHMRMHSKELQSLLFRHARRGRDHITTRSSVYMSRIMMTTAPMRASLALTVARWCTHLRNIDLQVIKRGMMARVHDRYDHCRSLTWRDLITYLRSIPSHVWIHIGIVSVIVVITTGVYTYNLFGYPYYENDEGIYIAQAHALATMGHLSPYTYWYDHAPMGWAVLALFATLGDVLFAFGSSVNFGRVIMALFHICAILLIFQIVRRATKGYFAAVISTIIYGLSPLMLYYGRRVLLDNMMIVWVLGVIAILSKKKLTVTWVDLSAVLFAVAVLTKENAIVLMPVMWYGLFVRRTEFTQRWIVARWTGIAGCIISLYPLYAFFRGELYPGQSGSDHVSLIGTLQWQLSRTGADVPLWHMDSAFMQALRDWLYYDPYVMVAGIMATVIMVAWSVHDIRLRVIAWASVAMWVFLVRGGIVLNFYIMPLLPFMAIAIAIVADRWARYIADGRLHVFRVTATIFGAVIVGFLCTHRFDHFFVDETAAQVAVVHWVKEHIAPTANIAIDDYAYADYHDARFGNGVVFPRADIFWKIESDPRVRDDIYDGDWRNIDYVVTSSTFDTHLANGELGFVGDAAQSAREIASFGAGAAESFHTAVKEVDPEMPIPITYRNDPQTKEQLYRSFRTYKKYFFRTYGQIVDPDTIVTTSEGQSYTMLRAVWLDDRESFDGAWDWTRDHLQFRTTDALFSWKWVLDKLEDSNNATDADEDIALALLFAYAQWGDETYLTQAQEIIADIGEQSVRQINGTYYVLPSYWKVIEQPEGFLLNPSYLAPAHYRIFAQVDPTHPWEQIAADSYAVLHRVGTMNGNTTYLPSDWVLVDKETGELSSANAYFDHDTERFSYDAFRTLWRVSLDYQWFAHRDARAYLDRVNTYLIAQYAQDGHLPSAIAPDGSVIIAESTPAINAGYLAALMIRRDDTLARQFYEAHFAEIYDDDGHYWGGDRYNYYNANWAWFATAMYNGDMKNIFGEKAKNKNINE